MDAENIVYPEKQRFTEIIPQLEHIVSLPNSNKVDIILAAEGSKPASMIDLYFEPGHAAYSAEAYQHDIQALRQILDELKLVYHSYVSTDELPHATTFRFAKDKEHLEQLEAALQIPGEAGNISVGLALGYPETAVQAYAQGKKAMLTEIPKEIQDDPALKFLGFIMSKDHWQEEIKIGRQRAEMVREIAPTIYQESIS